MAGPAVYLIWTAMNFSDLYAKHQKSLSRVARRILRNAADADDVTQEAFLRALSSNFRGECQPFSWLYRLVLNAAIDQARKNKTRWANESVCYSRRPRPAVEDPSRDCERAELRRALSSAIAQLPEKYLIPFRLHLLCGWPFPEIGQACGLPVNTAKIRIFRARRMLQVLLADWDPYPKS